MTALLGAMSVRVREEEGHLEDDVSLQQAAVLRRQPRRTHLLDEDLTAQTQAVLYTTTHTPGSVTVCWDENTSV